MIALFRAQWQSQWGSGAWPVAPLLVHATIAAALCALVRESLAPFEYSIFALGLSAALLTLVLLGDFAPQFVDDEAQEWIEAQPVRPIERRIARALGLLTLILALALASLVPAALLQPEASLLGGLRWLSAGLAQAVLLAAGILALSNALAGRAAAVWIGVQTALVSLAVLALILAPAISRALHQQTLRLEGLWNYLPPIAFARALQEGSWWVWSSTVLALAALVAIPPAKHSARRFSVGPLDRLLAPLRRPIARLWVRAKERASYEFVLDALPRERDFVLRTYPMLGIPLALLFAGKSGEALLTLLLFAPPIYLPVLLVQVPASQSHAARWIFDTAPVKHSDLHAGARKALVLRFVLPLYLVLTTLSAWLASPSFALRVAPIALLSTVLILKPLYTKLVEDLPLSVAPDRILARMDWTGMILGVAMLLVALATLTQLWVRSALHAGLACAVLCALLWFQDRPQKELP